MTASPAQMQKMLAEWQMRDVIARYARGVDRRDGTIIGECFHKGASMHYGDFDDRVEAFVPWVLAYLEPYSATMHVMEATIIDWPVGGNDVAISETYATVWHEVAADQPGRSWVGGIRYIDRFELQIPDGGGEPQWRIAERTVVGDLLRIDPSENHRRFADVMLTGKPSRKDPIFGQLARHGGQ